MQTDSKYEVICRGFEDYVVIRKDCYRTLLENISFGSCAKNLVFQLENGIITEDEITAPPQKEVKS